MARLTSLCVYCGSSDRGGAAHRDAAAWLGRESARRGLRLVFGGGRVGLMGVLADAALAAGGEVIGIIPTHLKIREVYHPALTRLEEVESMHVRKARMCELSDAFCILPGGLGTLDETFEIVTWKQLKLHDKPVVVVNQNGYWDPFLDLIAHQVEAGYLHPGHSGLFTVASDVTGVFDAIAGAPEPRIGLEEARL